MRMVASLVGYIVALPTHDWATWPSPGVFKLRNDATQAAGRARNAAGLSSAAEQARKYPAHGGGRTTRASAHDAA